MAQDRADRKSAVRQLLLVVLMMASVVWVAFVMHRITDAFPNQVEKSVWIIGAFCVLLLALPPLVYLLFRRREVDPGRLGLITLTTLSVVMVAIYLYWVSYYVFFPADILTWSESDFVNDILKVRSGYPIYTAQVNNESFLYPPGAQLLTYFLAWLTGRATSIPLYRIIQVGYCLLAAGVAVRCCRRLVELSVPARRFRHSRLWLAFWLPTFFLIATNSQTNPYTHNLHNDALAQLITVTAYGLLLEYLLSRDKRLLVLMALIPAAGFFVKQSLVVWAPLYLAFLVFFDRPRSVKRVFSFVVISFSGIAATLAGCYLLWRGDFVYWVFKVMGNRGVSPLRSFQHVLAVWPYFAIGLLAGFVLLRGRNFRLLFGHWLIWLSLISFQAYTSGIAWMLNHMGPGCLIAGIWFFAALVRVWPLDQHIATRKLQAPAWLRTSVSVVVVGLLFSGLGMIRIPTPPIDGDAYRYVKHIEREFDGESAKDTLLDMGTWVYIKDGVIMKDRAPGMGDRGYSGTGDFSGIIQRLEQRRYSKILIRNYHSSDFWYDHGMWSQSSGIRQTLLRDYHETGTIKGVEGDDPPYGFTEISILKPNSN